jgi:cbb3-type cytochrome oxidase maturation protein
MDVLYLLIPLSALLVLALAGLFAWATFGGQFEGLEREGERILDPEGGVIDSGQATPPGASQELPDRFRNTNRD